MTRTVRSIVLCSICVVGAAVLNARPAFGHAKLTAPKPRDTHADYKDPPQNNVGIGAPCGVAAAASQPSTTFAPGAPLTVTWQETVSHPGCFVIDFAAAGDANFQILGVKSHANPPSTTTPRNWSVGVTLPSTPCTGCTLRVRQLMLQADLSDSQCPPATIPAGATYYSCANVVLATGGGGGTTETAGTTGATGAAGTNGSAGTNGTTGAAGTSGGVGSAGTNGTAGTNGVAGTNGTAGTNGSAGTNGTTGAAGSAPATGAAGTGSGPGSGSGEVSGGCRIAPDAGLAPLLALGAAALVGRRRRRRAPR